MTSRRIDDAGISARYGASPKDVAAWIKLVNFPAADDDGLRDVDRVDSWVQAMRPQYWPPTSETVSAARVPSAQAAKPAAAARPAPATESRSEMAKRFNMSYQAVDVWTKAKERRDAKGKVVATAFLLPCRRGVGTRRRWTRGCVRTGPGCGRPTPAVNPSS